MGVNDEDFNKDNGYVEDEEVQLPGFRFHPTDEELVSFYLRRKLDNKPISIDLIKQIDIYKYDPWDLPKSIVPGVEKEGYFFCKRGRKYRNSVRPNRVTGSGFWKATGIDKPVYSNGGEGNDCVGLKKTLVYYRGSAGKGTKTEWMMHEFRLPSNIDTTTNLPYGKSYADHDIAQEAEIWTLCRIFKRNVSSQRRQTPELKQLSTKRQAIQDKSTRMNILDQYNTNQQTYINFGASLEHYQIEQKPITSYTHIDQRNNQYHMGQLSSSLAQQPQLNVAPSSNIWTKQAANDFLGFETWDELGSVVKFAGDSPSL